MGRRRSKRIAERKLRRQNFEQEVFQGEDTPVEPVLVSQNEIENEEIAPVDVTALSDRPNSPEATNQNQIYHNVGGSSCPSEVQIHVAPSVPDVTSGPKFSQEQLAKILSQIQFENVSDLLQDSTGKDHKGSNQSQVGSTSVPQGVNDEVSMPQALNIIANLSSMISNLTGQSGNCSNNAQNQSVRAKQISRKKLYSRGSETSSEEEFQEDHESEWAAPTVSRREKFTSAKLPPFTGKEQWEIWITRFEDVARIQKWSRDRCLNELLPRLQGQAAEFVYGQLDERTRNSYSRLINELNARFRIVETRRTYGVQFSNRQQKSGESVEEYAADLKRLYDKAYKNRDRSTRQEDLLRRFLDGLSDRKAKFHVEFSKEPSNIDEAVYEVVHFMETKKSLSRASRAVRSTDHDSTDYSSSDGDSDIEGKVAKIPSKSAKRDFKLKFKKLRMADIPPKSETEVNHRQEEASSQSFKDSKGPEDIEDKITKSMTTMSNNIDKTLKAILDKLLGDRTSSQGPRSSRGRGPRPDIKCYYCGLVGHIKKNCPDMLRGFPPSVGRYNQDANQGQSQSANARNPLN